MRASLAGAWLAAALLGSVVVADDDPGRRRALLIGIDDYLTDEFTDLRGAVNDVDAMRAVLVARYGFRGQDVTVLTDAGATRRAILDALDRLVADTTEDDSVYLHFSGHGSQVRDLDGDEPDDGLDETILPHDARTAGIADITDDELGRWLSRLRARAAVIVLDSCHSGTATRDLVTTRAVPPDPRIELYREAAVATRSLVALERPGRYVLLTGAAEHQSALDGPVDGGYRGFFSYALSESLADAPLDATPAQLHERVAAVFERLSERFGGLQLPDPQVEARPEILERALFPDAGSPRTATAATTAPPPIAASTPAPPVGPASAPVSAGPFADPVSVRWSTVDGARRAAIDRELRERIPGMRIVGSAEFAHAILELQDGRCTVYAPDDARILDEFDAGSDAETAARIARVLRRASTADALAALQNPYSGLALEARVLGTADEGRKRIRRPGEPRSGVNSLMIELRADRDCWVTIVDVDTEGEVSLLFPNDYTSAGFLEEGRIRAGRTVRIPDSYETGNRAGFFWDLRPPTGVDTIQVIASTDRETTDTIREWIDGLATRRTRDAAGTASGLDALRRVLTDGVARRGLEVVDPTSSPADWAAVAIELTIDD